MKKAELEIGKLYTHSPRQDGRWMELVRVISLEPQKTQHLNRAGAYYRTSNNLIRVSVISEFSGKETEENVLLKNLYPESEYHEEKERRERNEQAAKDRTEKAKELSKYLSENGERLRAALGVSYSQPYARPYVEITLNREQIEALLERKKIARD